MKLLTPLGRLALPPQWRGCVPTGWSRRRRRRGPARARLLLLIGATALLLRPREVIGALGAISWGLRDSARARRETGTATSAVIARGPSVVPKGKAPPPGAVAEQPSSGRASRVLVLPEAGPEIDRNSSIGALAKSVLRQQVRAMLSRIPDVEPQRDPEAVHDVRVAMRRSRSAIRIFAPWLPPEALSVDEELRWLGGELGDARDLEVQRQRLERYREELPSLDVDALLGHRVESAQRRAVVALDSERARTLVDALTALSTLPADADAGGPPATEVAPGLIDTSWRRLRRRARRLTADSPAEEYHRARIAAKRMRYAAEFVQPLYGKRSTRAVSALKELQDLLGEQNDTEVAQQLLGELVTDAERPLDADTAFVLGELVARERAASHEHRAAMPDIYRRVRRRVRALQEQAPIEV